MSSRRPRNPLPGRPLDEVKAAALAALGRCWPDALATPILIERLGAPPSSVRRALERLVADGHVERAGGRGWRAVRSSAAPNSALRPGRPPRHLGFRDAFLRSHRLGGNHVG